MAGALVLCLSGGCAESPVPQGYDGPTATIADSAYPLTSARSIFFYLAEVDGRRIPSSVVQSSAANAGAGTAQRRLVATERKVPAGQTLTLKLEARTGYAAPIQELFMHNTRYRVDELIEFAPKVDVKYVVRGILREDTRLIWLEEAGTGDHVGTTLQTTGFDERVRKTVQGAESVDAAVGNAAPPAAVKAE